MTVCIAAITDKGKNIVLAADRLLSSNMKVSESRLYKMIHVHPRWMAMFSFDDLDIVSDITSRMQRKLAEPGHLSIEEVRKRMREAYTEVRFEKIEALYLKPRNLTWQDYRSDGCRDRLGDAIFDSIDTDIVSFDLGVSFLIAGFDADNFARIFSIIHPGFDTEHSVQGYFAIGSGAENALAILSQREVEPLMFLSKTLYFVYEARKFAGYARGVGKKIVLMVIRPNKWGQAGKEDLAALEQVWEYAKPKVVDREQLQLRGIQQTKLVQEFPAEY